MKKILTLLVTFLFSLVIPNKAHAQVNYENIVNNPPSIATISNQKTDVQTELNRVIGEIIPLGHLSPTIYNAGLGQHNLLYYHAPSETINVLSQAYPYVSESLKPQLLNYLQTEISKYPPQSTPYYDGIWSGTVNDFKGSKREYFSYATFATSSNVWPPPTVNKSVLYSVWAYAYYTNSWGYAQTNYNSLKSIFSSIQSSGISSYDELSGVIGFARIASHFSNTTDYNAAVSLANTANSSSFSTYLATAEAAHPNADHVYQVALFQNGNNSRSFHFDKDIGTAIKINDQGPALSYADKICADIPLCWLTAPSMSHGENSYTLPEISWTYFLLESYVGDKNTLELQKLLDRPDRKGDLFYIQKLVATLQAPDSITATPTASATPAQTACQKADINQDNFVDLSDYSIIAINFLTATPSNARADINQDGFVDLSDYSQLAIQFLNTCN